VDLHARLTARGGQAGRVAIVLDMAAGPRVAALRLEARGVTPREREIAALLAQGQSNGRSPPHWCSRRTPFRTTSRACSIRPGSPRAESSSPGSSSRTICRRSPTAARAHGRGNLCCPALSAFRSAGRLLRTTGRLALTTTALSVRARCTCQRRGRKWRLLSCACASGVVANARRRLTRAHSSSTRVAQLR
jgi:hypothetical protein